MANDKPHHRTIRIRLDTYRRLKVLAAQMGVSMVALIEQWVTESEHTVPDNVPESKPSPQSSASERRKP